LDWLVAYSGTVLRVPRWVIFTALVVIMALGALSSLAVGTARRSLPDYSGELVLPGLIGTVEVKRDSYGVPHVYADNPEDLFLAQGYIQASDRFYEMDYRRHLAAGRLSELYGPGQVEADSYIRTLGWRRVAEEELALLSASTRRYLDAYASGVNAYIRGKPAADLSLEYSVLGVQGLDYQPEEWRAADSVSWLKVMAWNLGSNLDQESQLAIMTAKVGARRTSELYPRYPFQDFEPIVSRGTIDGEAFDPTAERISARSAPIGLSAGQLRRASPTLSDLTKIEQAIPQVLGSHSLGQIGSNSWAVSGARTATGKAMLGNDPHLATSIPSTFAQVGLHCRSLTKACPFDVSGFSLASVPGVVIGKNTRIAWGLTTSNLDVQDLYLEDVNGDLVRRGDSYTPLEIRTELISVLGEAQPRSLRIRTSRHGPLLSDVSTSLQSVGTTTAAPGKAPYAVALSWVALTPGRSMDALMKVNTAGNFTEFRAAAKLLSAPSQNLMYADVEGNIGYQLPGDAPLRGQGDGRMPSPGWDDRYDWKGRIPFAQLPYDYNPPSGFIVAANQQIIGRQYPYRLGSNFSYGWRSQELIDRLEISPPLTADSAEQLFYDDTIRVAAEVVPTLLRIRVDDSWVREGQQMLVGWDYSAEPSSPAAAYFYVVFHNILKLTFRDEMPEELWPAGGDRWYAVVSSLLKSPRSRWWDDLATQDRVETRDDILLAAMTQGRKEITSLIARDTDEWEWGKLHRATLRNSTLGESDIAVVERLFNRGEYGVSGGPAVVNAMAFDDREGYHVTSGPTMRMLIDLGDLDASRWVNQSGVSGHAFARNYDDQTSLWAAGRMLPFVSSPAAVDARTVDRLRLTPGG
jgi:penicillin G amidase